VRLRTVRDGAGASRTARETVRGEVRTPLAALWRFASWRREDGGIWSAPPRPGSPRSGRLPHPHPRGVTPQNQADGTHIQRLCAPPRASSQIGGLEGRINLPDGTRRTRRPPGTDAPAAGPPLTLLRAVVDPSASRQISAEMWGGKWPSPMKVTRLRPIAVSTVAVNSTMPVALTLTHSPRSQTVTCPATTGGAA
jgi:hypothetical protein